MVITNFEIRIRVRQLAEMITQQFLKSNSIKDPIYLIGVLDGSFMFLADLARELQLNVKVLFLVAKSYKGTESKHLQVFIDPLEFEEIRNQHVIIVEDIVDTGKTIKDLVRKMQLFRPSTLDVCTLLEKPGLANDYGAKTTYTGFLLDQNEDFVIGYGMDLDGRFRNVPFITTLQEIKDSPYSYLHKYI